MCLAALVLAVAASWHTLAVAVDLSLELAAEYRHFPSEPMDDRQFDHHNTSLSARPEAFLDWDNRDQSLTLALFGRLDQNDDERTHADIRELFYRYVGRRFELRLGVRKVFWGVAESANLVDVVNQHDFVEGLGGEAKLGQPMVDLAMFTGYGTLNFYVMPYFRERTFAAADGRPRLLLPVAEDLTRYEDPEGQSHIDLAFRYSNSFGPVDLGLSYFRGTNRDPRFDFVLDECQVTARASLLGLIPFDQQFGCDEEPPDQPPLTDVEEVRVETKGARFVPVYETMEQVGIDAQLVRGGLALKAEAIHRRSDFTDFTAAVTGLEFTLYGVLGSAIDLGLLGEHLWDERGLIPRDIAEASVKLARDEDFVFDSAEEARAFADSLRQTTAAAFQNDLFVGNRISFNDVAGTQILAGAVIDLDTGAVLGNIEANRRLGGNWRGAINATLLSDVPITDPLFGFADDDFVEITLTRFF